MIATLGFQVATINISIVEFYQTDLQEILKSDILYVPDNKVFCAAIEFFVKEAPDLVGDVIEMKGNIVITADKCFMAIEHKNVELIKD